MQERKRLEERDREAEQEHERATAAPAPAIPAQEVLALQRTAGNAALSRLLTSPARTVARGPDPSPPAPPPKARVSYVFLMGELSDPYYVAAREYFEAAFKGATMVIDKRTLADVIDHVNSAGKPVDTLYIVSHAGDTGFLQFSLDAADLKQDKDTGNQKPNATFGELKEANDRGTLPKANTKLIDDKTKIKIKGCDIGRSERTLDELDEAFGGKASVTAPTHAQEFRSGGKGGTPAEHLNRMFVEWPGDVTKNAADRAKAFKDKYPMVPAGRWKDLLKQAKKDDKANQTLFVHTQANPIGPKDEKAALARVDAAKRWPSSQGWVVKFAGRRVDGDDYRYEVRAEKGGGTGWHTQIFTIPVPPTDDKLIDAEKAKHGRPEAAKWSVKKKVTGDQLEMKVVAERTEWFITGTVQDDKGPIDPAETDTDWYRTSTFAPPVTPAKPKSKP